MSLRRGTIGLLEERRKSYLKKSMRKRQAAIEDEFEKSEQNNEAFENDSAVSDDYSGYSRQSVASQFAILDRKDDF